MELKGRHSTEAWEKVHQISIQKNKHIEKRKQEGITNSTNNGAIAKIKMVNVIIMIIIIMLWVVLGDKSTMHVSISISN